MLEMGVVMVTIDTKNPVEPKESKSAAAAVAAAAVAAAAAAASRNDGTYLLMR